MHDGIMAIAERRAPEIREWMARNHPWQNVTGSAEASLYAEVKDLVEKAMITFGHDMPYSIFLETKNAGVWGVIAPALDYWSEIIWADVLELFK